MLFSEYGASPYFSLFYLPLCAHELTWLWLSTNLIVGILIRSYPWVYMVVWITQITWDRWGSAVLAEMNTFENLLKVVKRSKGVDQTVLKNVHVNFVFMPSWHLGCFEKLLIWMVFILRQILWCFALSCLVVITRTNKLEICHLCFSIANHVDIGYQWILGTDSQMGCSVYHVRAIAY